MSGYLFVGAFQKAEASFTDFAKVKFQIQADIFRQDGKIRELEGPGWRGLLQETEDSERKACVVMKR